MAQNWMHFDTWLVDNEGETREVMRDRMLSNGYEEEFEERIDELEEQFLAYCEEYDIEPHMD